MVDRFIMCCITWNMTVERNLCLLWSQCLALCGEENNSVHFNVLRCASATSQKFRFPDDFCPSRALRALNHLGSGNLLTQRHWSTSKDESIIQSCYFPLLSDTSEHLLHVSIINSPFSCFEHTFQWSLTGKCFYHHLLWSFLSRMNQLKNNFFILPS